MSGEKKEIKINNKIKTRSHTKHFHLFHWVLIPIHKDRSLCFIRISSVGGPTAHRQTICDLMFDHFETSVGNGGVCNRNSKIPAAHNCKINE